MSCKDTKKNIGNSKNTLVLLDYALSLPDRRLFAKKIKASFSDKIFAVIDRVLLMFLVNNYSVQFINQILMSVMMPFSYCQPYVWDSSKVMPPEIFIGRQEELEKIESPSGVNIVYGGRQLGKSALLKKAKMDIPPVVELGMRLEKQQIGLEGPVLQEQEMIEKIVKLYRSKCGGKKDAAR